MSKKTCPDCGGLPGIYPNSVCPTCWVKKELQKEADNSVKELDELKLYEWENNDEYLGRILLSLQYGETDSISHKEAKKRLNALIEEKVREASKYQIGVRLVNERREIWGLNIAHKGRCIFGDIYKSEQKAYDAIPAVIAELQDNESKEKA